MTLEPAAYKLDVLYFKFTRAFIMILLFLLLVHTYGADRFWSMAQRQRSAARLFFYFDRDRETHSAGDSETQTQLRFGHARFWL